MAVSLEQFSKQLSESGAITEQDLRAFVEKLPAADKPTDGEQLAKRLVREKKISAYQAQVVYSGKGKSLTMGSYFVLDKLGQGGMGMVLKAQHRMMKRLVAIKVLSPTVTKTKELQQRFQREVEAAARLTHPNIVGAFDAGDSNGSPFLVMEYVPGDDLSSIVKKKGPLSADQAIDFILQAARGLQFAHEQGVIHRDIKPANLLLDTKGVVKILDMGLARIEADDVATQANLTGTGTVMGTVDYMAPEQALSTKHADARSDLYSLGISLWFLLTGKSAYEGDSLMARLLAHREQPIPSLRAVRSDVSESLERVFRKLVAKQQVDRYQTAAELIVALEGCRTGATVSVVAVEEVGTEVDEFQNFLKSVDSPLEGRGGGKAKPSMAATRTEVRSEPSVTSAEETMPPLNVGDTSQMRGKKIRKKKPMPWFYDPRILIGGGAAAVVAIAVVMFLPRSERRIPTEKSPATQTAIASTKRDPVPVAKPVQSKLDPSDAIAPFKAIGNPTNSSKPAHDPKTRFMSANEAGPDFEVQGEYIGMHGDRSVGVQIVALGDGNFSGVVFPGGLPGAGWDVQKRVKYPLSGETNAGTTRLTGNNFEVVIANGKPTLKESGIVAELSKQNRISPTQGKRPPEGAIVLFDGNNVDQWDPGKLAEGNLMGIGTRTKEIFESYTLHFEFRTPFMPLGRGQGRGNSGLYLGDQYEIQILDSFGLEGVDNECGGIYRNAKPLVNMCFPPLSWQTYDIDFTCAKFDADDKVTAPAKVTIRQNGVLIHENQEVKPTPGGGRADQKPGAIFLQDHSDSVRFQNIWLVPKK